MGPDKRKRGKSARLSGATERPSKRQLVEDEEILSDEAEDLTGNVETPPSPQSDQLSSEPEDETVEERRLRLARAYLRHVGVSEDATLDADGHLENGGEVESDKDEDNALLREHALVEAGRVVVRLADRFQSVLSDAKVTRCKGHVKAPTCVALAREDISVAASGGKDSRVIVWDVAMGKRKSMFCPTLKGSAADADPAVTNGHVGPVDCVVLTDDGRIAASGGADGFVRVWDVRDPRPVAALRGHRGPVRGLALRAGSRQLFSASNDRTVKIWDLAELAYVETLFGHGGEVNSIDAMISERALSCGRDGTVRLYKVLEGSQLMFRSAKTNSIDTVAAINEQRFISGGDDGTVCLWQLNKKRPTAVVEYAHGKGLGCDAWITAVNAFRNTDLAVSGGGDGKVRFWKCEDVPQLFEIGDIDVGPGFINGLALGQQYDVLAVAVGNEHRLGRWSRIQSAKNTIQLVSLPIENE